MENRRWRLVDAHADTLLGVLEGRGSLARYSPGLGLDLPRLVRAGVEVQFLALFVESRFLPGRALERTLALLECFHREREACAGRLELLTGRQQLLEPPPPGRVRVLLAVEGGEALQGSLEALRLLYRLGVRSLTLTWNRNNELADGAGEPAARGLTAFGRQVVAEMGRLGMLVDVSHLGERGFWDTLEAAAGPLAASHSCCRRLHDHPRNLTDEQLQALAAREGVAGVTLAPDFLGEGAVGVAEVLAHIEHACAVAGPRAVGIGSDLDGVEPLPVGLEDASALPRLAEELLRRNYREEDVRWIMGENWLRLLARVLK